MPTSPTPYASNRNIALIACTCALMIGGTAWGTAHALMGSADAPPHDGRTVTQAYRTFSPTLVNLEQGDRLRIVNDDGNTIHHAYIDDPLQRFDSGDQEPGYSAVIPFNTVGTFQVLCGIHPKMKMVVNVR